MTGWTWDQVRDQLDLPRVDLLRDQWNKNPPLVVTMRAAAEALGVEFTGSKLLADDGEGYGIDQAMIDEMGMVEGPVYVRPRMGLPLDEPVAQM